MKKFFIAAVCLLLAVMTLAGCTPASSIIKETTAPETGIFAKPGENFLNEPKDYVIKSENYAFYVGEYMYFFITTLSSFSKDDLEVFGYKEGVSLKEQKVKGHDVTWFEFIDAITVEKLQKILVACEYAYKEKTSYITDAKAYIELVKRNIKEASDNDPDGYVKELYGGAVSYQSYLNACQMEYIYELYYRGIYADNMEIISDSELKEYAKDPENKDTTPVRKVVYFTAESRGKAQDFIDELGNEVTEKAIFELADVHDLTAVNDTLTKDSDIAAEMIEWCFSSEREVGEGSVIRVEKEDLYEYWVVYYFGEGEETYLFRARVELAGKLTDTQVESAVESYKSFTVDKKMLDGINI